MEWLKKGKIDYSRWMHINKYASDFATLPTPIAINNEIIRIFIGFCDNNNVGTISYIDVLADNPSEVVNISEAPVLKPGVDGCFDDNGVVPLSVVWVGSEIYLYYVGFQLGVKVPYFMFGGLAISTDAGILFPKYQAFQFWIGERMSFLLDVGCMSPMQSMRSLRCGI